MDGAAPTSPTRPEEALAAYVTAFATLEPEAVLPFYHLPCLFVSPQGAHAITEPAGLRALVTALMAQARGQGYHRTGTVGLEARRLGTALASLSGTFVRFNAAGGEIGRFGFAYTLRLGEEGWRIAVALAHDVPG